MNIVLLTISLLKTICSETTDRVHNVRFVYQNTTELGIVWESSSNLTNIRTSIHDGHETDPNYAIKTTLQDRNNSVSYSGLQPAAVYWITIDADFLDGEPAQASTIKVYTLAAAAKDVRTKFFDDRCVTLEWQNDNQVREQVQCYARVQHTRTIWRDQECIGSEQNMVRICDMPPGTSWDINIWYATNLKKSNTYSYRFVTQPRPITEAVAQKITMLDEERADLDIAWTWPADGNYWGLVKIVFSPPPIDDLGTPSPYFIDRRLAYGHSGAYPNNTFNIEKIHQGNIYTICISLVKGSIESEPLCFEQSVPKINPNTLRAMTVSEDSLIEPTHRTCHIPLGLAPKRPHFELKIADMEPSMNVTWERPELKSPENGYEIILAPEVDDAVEIPTIIHLLPGEDYNETDSHITYQLTADKFNPYNNYHISIIAEQEERKNNTKPNGVDFVARIYRMVFLKIICSFSD